jgi:glycosyltransferase involved in cell wall biosynthesis
MNKLTKYFVYVGNAYPHKNLERLIAAFVLLNRNKKEKIKLKIVSARSIFIERLKGVVKHKNAEDLVEIVNFVPEKELINLYKNSVAFVFPTLAEGFGLPPMEAIAAGALVIASDIPVLKEVYQGSIFYFDPYNVNSIVESLNKVVVISPSDKVKCLKSAQLFIKRYSWAKMAQQTLAVYKSV